MRVQSVYVQGVKDVNEDELLVGETVFGVFDGATGLVPYRNENGETGGQVAARIAKKVFESSIVSEPLEGLAIKANREIAHAMNTRGIDTSNALSRWSTTAAVVRVKQDELEFAGISDSCILGILPGGGYQLLVPYHNQDAHLLQVWKSLTDEEKRECLMSLRREANVTYGVLNGDGRAENFLRAGTCKTVFDSVLIFTDGLIIPKRDAFGDEDWKTFVELYRAGNMQGPLPAPLRRFFHTFQRLQSLFLQPHQSQEYFQPCAPN